MDFSIAMAVAKEIAGFFSNLFGSIKNHSDIRKGNKVNEKKFRELIEQELNAIKNTQAMNEKLLMSLTKNIDLIYKMFLMMFVEMKNIKMRDGNNFFIIINSDVNSELLVKLLESRLINQQADAKNMYPFVLEGDCTEVDNAEATDSILLTDDEIKIFYYKYEDVLDKSKRGFI